MTLQRGTSHFRKGSQLKELNENQMQTRSLHEIHFTDRAATKILLGVIDRKHGQTQVA